ncbi:MAG TPA: PilN domain-containing protein [Methylocella sp.]|jgi:general secretion pathway protein L
MISYADIVETCSRWIDRVAMTIVAGRQSLRMIPYVQLAEQQDGTFTVRRGQQGDVLDLPGPPIRLSGDHTGAEVAGLPDSVLRGAKVEVVLRPQRFMFRPLELPRRALDFLDGIVRAQIDRLTPWSADAAAFGWHSEVDPANDRIDVTIAATAKTLIAPFISAVTALGADTVILSAALPHPVGDAATIKISEQKAGQAADARRLRRILIGLAAGGSALASLSIAANAIVGGMFETQRDDVLRRVTERRALMQPGRNGASEAARALEQHKHEIPSTVIAIEALSQVLPDDTYLTELRILGDKIQIVGVTKDAPSLIRLIEQTSHFSKATFFAPTTRSASEQTEHFHIEARIEPVYTPGL